MARRLVVCESKEAALAAHAAGILQCKYTSGWVATNISHSKWVDIVYGTRFWPPEDFAVLLDDDEDG